MTLRGAPPALPPRRDGGYVLVIALLIVGILFVAASFSANVRLRTL